MLDRMITRTQLVELVDEWALRTRSGERALIVGPVRREPSPVRYLYEPVDRAARLDLDFNYCVYSPKSFLLPPREVLFTYHRSDGTFHATPRWEDRPIALVGVHPCDLHAIRLLDHVFQQDHPDPHYQARRRQMLIIGIDCATPCTEGVFCRDMHTHDADRGFDLMCYPLDQGSGANDTRYGVVFGSEAGRELILYAQAGTPPSANDERRMAQYRAEKEDAFPRQIPYDVEALPALMDRSYDSLLWQATARRCYSCGSCNLVCPTCYCFNMYDDPALGNGQGSRLREWDGCQLASFALVAGPHNFRAKAAERLRHRMYRKAKWIHERTGLPGCVGCARCDRACTAKISSVEIYHQLAEEA